MATLRVKNVPDDLHERLREQARRYKTPLNNLVVLALEREIVQIELHERIAAKEPMEFEVSPSEILARERAQRDAPIEF